MRGQEPIIAMRRRGLKPRMVFIDAYIDSATSWRTWPELDTSCPMVEIAPTDQLSSLDFRFVVGLLVMVTGHDQRRVDAISTMCIEAGASRVVATTLDDTAIDTTTSGTRRIVSQSDSAGKLKPLSAADTSATNEIVPWSIEHRYSAPLPYPGSANLPRKALA